MRGLQPPEHHRRKAGRHYARGTYCNLRKPPLGRLQNVSTFSAIWLPMRSGGRFALNIADGATGGPSVSAVALGASLKLAHSCAVDHACVAGMRFSGSLINCNVSQHYARCDCYLVSITSSNSPGPWA